MVRVPDIEKQRNRVALKKNCLWKVSGRGNVCNSIKLRESTNLTEKDAKDSDDDDSDAENTLGNADDIKTAEAIKNKRRKKNEIPAVTSLSCILFT